MNPEGPSRLSYTNFSGWSLFFCGMCMGAADLVPGVSGGTIAFILGFYNPLLESLKTLNKSALKHLFKGQWAAFREMVAWKFLFILLMGIICSFLGLANLIQSILSDEFYRVYLYSAFLGLILASCIFCLKQISQWDLKVFFGLFLGAVLAYGLTDMTLAPTQEGKFAVTIDLPANYARNYDDSSHLLTGLTSQTVSFLLDQGVLQETSPVYDHQHVLIGLAGELVAPVHISFFNGWLVMSGALAIFALLLPGISGSYVLTLLGVYPVVIEALTDFISSIKALSFNIEAFWVLSNLGFGIILGALGFVRFASWLLREYPNVSLAVLSGFMVGAIRSVWPFWSYDYLILPLKLYKGPQLIALQPLFPSLNSFLFWQASLCALGAFVFFFSIEAYAKSKSR